MRQPPWGQAPSRRTRWGWRSLARPLASLSKADGLTSPSGSSTCTTQYFIVNLELGLVRKPALHLCVEAISVKQGPAQVIGQGYVEGRLESRGRLCRECYALCGAEHVACTNHLQRKNNSCTVEKVQEACWPNLAHLTRLSRLASPSDTAEKPVFPSFESV